MKKILFIFTLAIVFMPLVCFAEQIDINSATLSQLDGISHVGAKTAQKIIDGRPYSSVNDLSRVKGIGNGKYLQDIIAQGWACVNCQTQISETQQKALNPVIYPSGIFINEILPNPEGADETDEWIEIFNSNNFDVDLSGWQIQDTAGTPATYTISKDAKILANGFLVFKRPDTKIMLNNDEDGINLLTPDKKIIDSVNFIKAQLGQSYSKASSGWAWSTTLTPSTINIIRAVVAKNSKTVLPESKISVNNNVDGAGLADLSQAISANQENNNLKNPWFLFFSALAITVVSATIVLFIKLRFRNVTKT